MDTPMMLVDLYNVEVDLPDGNVLKRSLNLNYPFALIVPIEGTEGWAATWWCYTEDGAKESLQKRNNPGEKIARVRLAQEQPSHWEVILPDDEEPEVIATYLPLTGVLMYYDPAYSEWDVVAVITEGETPPKYTTLTYCEVRKVR